MKIIPLPELEKRAIENALRVFSRIRKPYKSQSEFYEEVATALGVAKSVLYSKMARYEIGIPNPIKVAILLARQEPIYRIVRDVGITRERVRTIKRQLDAKERSSAKPATKPTEPKSLAKEE